MSFGRSSRISTWPASAARETGYDRVVAPPLQAAHDIGGHEAQPVLVVGIGVFEQHAGGDSAALGGGLRPAIGVDQLRVACFSEPGSRHL